MSKEHSIWKLSTLGLLAHSVRLLSFHTDFTIHEIAGMSIAQQPSELFQPNYSKLIMCLKFRIKGN